MHEVGTSLHAACTGYMYLQPDTSAHMHEPLLSDRIGASLFRLPRSHGMWISSAELHAASRALCASTFQRMEADHIIEFRF